MAGHARSPNGSPVKSQRKPCLDSQRSPQISFKFRQKREGHVLTSRSWRRWLPPGVGARADQASGQDTPLCSAEHKRLSWSQAEFSRFVQASRYRWSHTGVSFLTERSMAMNTTTQSTCKCTACPGAGCVCGCQKTAEHNACTCGPQCQCGTGCACGPQCQAGSAPAKS